MERDVRLDWPALVEEARRRRKAQNFTQERLAAIANVSTPTISRFESGEKNVQLASVLAILEALGMLKHLAIAFPDKIERYDSDRDAVLYLGRTDEGEITCAIGGEALEDHFGGRGPGGRARLAAFRANRTAIEAATRRKFESGRRERDGSVRIRSEDL